MKESFLARTGGESPQTYFDHISGVMNRCLENAEEILKFSAYTDEEKRTFMSILLNAAQFHDLGKLDEQNQRVFQSNKSRASLPIPHVDAGCAYLMSKISGNKKSNLSSEDKALLESTLMIFSHHAGLPYYLSQKNNRENPFRYEDPDNSNITRKINDNVNRHLNSYIHDHREALGSIEEPDFSGMKPSKPSGLSRRLGLSCLVDADFSDAAAFFDNYYLNTSVEPRWEERLAALQEYVKKLGKKGSGSSTRQAIRDEVFQCCLNATIGDYSMETCLGAVGVGKTTSVMAHLLQIAIKRKLRRIYVVLPYTQIIHQSVDVYRSSLVLPGEDPELVVAEHHHLADFKDDKSKQFAVLWNSPIVVTTAVQFFETLGSNMPATLRKLHSLPGSAVFVDEAHNVMPTTIWPLEWRWLKELAQNWRCHFVFASGSLIKYWENESFIQNDSKDTPVLPEIIPENLQQKIQEQENKRIEFEQIKKGLSVDDLINELIQPPIKSSLVVVNTVYNAAFLASRLKERLLETEGNARRVMHLSTALSPYDRQFIVQNIRNALNPQLPDYIPGLILVATSCVEAGVDFSFQSAYRESCSAASLFQIAGRVNRNDEMKEPGNVYSFRFFDSQIKNNYRAFEVSSNILDDLLREGVFQDNQYSTTDILKMAFEREIRSTNVDKAIKELLDAEKHTDYPEVAKLCKVIPASDTYSVIVNPKTIEKLENGSNDVSAMEIQLNSVQIWSNNCKRFGVQEIENRPGLLKWTLGYDPDFLGYMTEDALNAIKASKDGYMII